MAVLSIAREVLYPLNTGVVGLNTVTYVLLFCVELCYVGRSHVIFDSSFMAS
jgi:hypothetical protein